MAFGVVGLTGGIASGKSTVARFFRRQGIPVIDADQVAREVVEPGTPGLAAIVARFGEEVLDAEGRLDRPKLGARVFSDPAARRDLNAITHPLIGQRSFALFAEKQREGAPFVVYEAALLVENKIYPMLGALVVVAVGEEAQRARLAARDGLSEEEIEGRLGAQLPLSEKLEVADYVIWNEGSVEELEARALEVHRALLLRFGGESER